MLLGTLAFSFLHHCSQGLLCLGHQGHLNQQLHLLQNRGSTHTARLFRISKRRPISRRQLLRRLLSLKKATQSFRNSKRKNGDSSERWNYLMLALVLMGRRTQVLLGTERRVLLRSNAQVAKMSRTKRTSAPPAALLNSNTIDRANNGSRISGERDRNSGSSMS